VKDDDFIDFLELNKGEERFSIYVCDDFVRYSAAYIDHLEENGVIRITHSIYGSFMEEAPSYALTRKKSPKLYKNFVRALEDLKRRAGTHKIVSVADIESYNSKHL